MSEVDRAAASLARHPAIRAVNFHHTPHRRADDLERQLERLARHFAVLDEAGLERLMTGETGPAARPPLVIAFYNGLRDNLDVAVPILDRLGLKAWFFVPTGFVLEPAEMQVSFAGRNAIGLIEGDYPDGRHALSPAEMRALAASGHAIAAHTRTHAKASGTDEAALGPEIVGAQDDMRAILGRPVAGFAFQSGAPLGDNPVADALLARAGYRFLFSNLAIQRVG
ncbi:polysaccharide deacetylase family protein [Aureimonas sp. AU4]|uniref:polysaccharide deacetylase family protein n=1 Tax=Aureimonas sp. AU4 TaxID=1638163 RepID=UPI0007857CD5|nr:polysaccharide deacetylase family protein [Aureimonas sp. AU4]